jgi:hypothetical protein
MRFCVEVKVGVNLESIEVADDEQGRIAEVFAVIVELLVGCLEVLVLLSAALFVLPGKVIAPPDIGESIAAVDLRDGLFEGETLADAVGRGWVGLAEHLAEIYEVRLRSAAFGQCGNAPAFNELRWRQWHSESFPPRYGALHPTKRRSHTTYHVLWVHRPAHGAHPCGRGLDEMK